MRLSSLVRMSVLLLLFSGYLICVSLPLKVQAQSQNAQVTTKQGGTDLTEQQKKGENLFFQRCSLCHLGKTETPAPQPLKSFGPSLKGIVTLDADDDQMSFVREFIKKGTDRMPGFRYGLKESEIDDIIAYLKTL